MREHWNNMPGDIADEDAENVPGGLGTFNPDQNPSAVVDEVTDTDVVGPDGQAFIPTNSGGTIAGTNLVEAGENGATVDPRELGEGQEAAHPGATIGFTGDEVEKR